MKILNELIASLPGKDTPVRAVCAGALLEKSAGELAGYAQSPDTLNASLGQAASFRQIHGHGVRLLAMAREPRDLA